MTQPDLICYMNEYGIATTREATAKGWAAEGTQVWIMEPGYEYGTTEATARPLSEVLRVHHEDITQFPYVEWATEAPPGYCATCGCLQGHAPECLELVGKDYLASGWAVAGGEAVNPVDDDDCQPDPKGVSFAFNSGDYHGFE